MNYMKHKIELLITVLYDGLVSATPRLWRVFKSTYLNVMTIFSFNSARNYPGLDAGCGPRAHTHIGI